MCAAMYVARRAFVFLDAFLMTVCLFPVQKAVLDYLAADETRTAAMTESPGFASLTKDQVVAVLKSITAPVLHAAARSLSSADN